MKIVILDGYAENPGDLSWSGFERLGSLTVYDRTPYDRGNGEILSRAKGADAVITNKTPLTRETIEALSPELRYIGVIATGYNVVDIDAAREHGVPVCNIPSYSTEAVAQFTIALLLELCHHIGHHSDEVRRGRWGKNADFCFWDTPLVELQGKTFGIIGFGKIGQTTAKIASALGMRVVAYSPTKKECPFAEQLPLDEVFAQSDVISLHCPLFEGTRDIINAGSIAKMRDGVFILNTARGPLIDEKALADALVSGKVAGAAVDVLREEPPRSGSPLLSAPNCIITPHIAWASKECRTRLMDIAVGNLKAFIDGSPINVVNGI